MIYSYIPGISIFKKPAIYNNVWFSELQRAIRSLHWIGPAMLEAKLDRSKTKVSNLLDDAVTCFLQTNSSLLPR